MGFELIPSRIFDFVESLCALLFILFKPHEEIAENEH